MCYERERSQRVNPWLLILLAVIVSAIFAIRSRGQATFEVNPAKWLPIPIGYPAGDFEMFATKQWPDSAPNWLPWCPLDELDGYFGGGFGPGNRLHLVSGLRDEVYLVPVWRSSMMPRSWQGETITVDPKQHGDVRIYLGMWLANTAPFDPPLFLPMGAYYGLAPLLEVTVHRGDWQDAVGASANGTWPDQDLAVPLVFSTTAGALLPLVGAVLEVQVVFNLRANFGEGILAGFQAITETL